jgi:hypothetical protein
VYRNGKFYWFVAMFHKKDENSQGIGVASQTRSRAWQIACQ